MRTDGHFNAEGTGLRAPAGSPPGGTSSFIVQVYNKLYIFIISIFLLCCYCCVFPHFSPYFPLTAGKDNEGKRRSGVRGMSKPHATSASSHPRRRNGTEGIMNSTAGFVMNRTREEDVDSCISIPNRSGGYEPNSGLAHGCRAASAVSSGRARIS